MIETVLLWLFAATALVAAVLMLVLRHPMRVALALTATMLSLAGLLVPIPLMALDLLTGAVQAYIFAVLAMVFIGGAVSEGRTGGEERERL